MQHIIPSRVFNTHAAVKRLQDVVHDLKGQSELGCVAVDGRPLLASLIDEAVEPFTALVDWWQKDDLQRQMRSRIKRQLRASGIAAEAVETLAADIVALAKVRTDR